MTLSLSRRLRLRTTPPCTTESVRRGMSSQEPEPHGPAYLTPALIRRPGFCRCIASGLCCGGMRAARDCGVGGVRGLAGRQEVGRWTQNPASGLDSGQDHVVLTCAHDRSSLRRGRVLESPTMPLALQELKSHLWNCAEIPVSYTHLRAHETD